MCFLNGSVMEMSMILVNFLIFCCLCYFLLGAKLFEFFWVSFYVALTILSVARGCIISINTVFFWISSLFNVGYFVLLLNLGSDFFNSIFNAEKKLLF